MKVWLYYIIGLWLVGRAFSMLIEDNEKDVARSYTRGYDAAQDFYQKFYSKWTAPKIDRADFSHGLPPSDG